MTWLTVPYIVFHSGPSFPVFSPNIGKYGPEITPYLHNFHAVKVVINLLCHKGL